MNITTYDETDVLDSPDPSVDPHPYRFVHDVVGDNADLFGDWDNAILQEHLIDRVGLPERTTVDSEDCCFFAYFPDKATGRKFIELLNRYIRKKSELMTAARDY